MADLARIKENVAKMASMNAPEADIDGYIASEGASLDDVRNFQLPAENTFSSRLQADFQKRKGDDKGAATAAVQGFNSIVPYGNRITAGLASAALAPFTDLTMGELYDTARANQQATSEASPNAELAGGLAGVAATLPIGFVKAASASPLFGATANALQKASTATGNFIRGGEAAANAGRLAKAANLAGQSARSAVVAAPTAALYGAGAANEGEQLQGAVTGAGLGAAIGAAVPVAAAGLGGAAAYGADKLFSKTIRPTAEQLKPISQANYAKAEQLGGRLSNKANDEFIDFAQGFGQKDEMASVMAGQSPLASAASDLEKFRGQPLTLGRATAVDQAITDRLDDAAFHTNGVLNVYGRQLLEIKNKLRDTLSSAADKGLVEGGREGIDAYKTAVKDWAAQSQISEIQRIVDKASYMDNPATALKTGFRNIATNPGRLNKYPKDVQKAIKNAARDGDVSNILRSQIGSRLISGAIGAATGSAAGPLGTIAGAVAGGATGGLARRAAESMQMNRVNSVVDAIAANSSLPTQKVKRFGKKEIQEAFEAKKTAQAKPKMLTYQPQQTDIITGSGGARQLTPEEQIAVAAQRENAATIESKVVLTPEQRAIAAKIQVPTTARAFERPIAAPQKTTPAATTQPAQPKRKNYSFAESGKPTSLATFIRKNDGLKDDGGDLRAMGYRTLINPYGKGMSIDDLGEELWQQGFFSERPTTNQVLDLIAETKGGKTSYAPKDITRVNKAQEKAAAAGQNDPSYVEFSADQLGIDTANKTTKQLIKEINEKMRGS